METSPSSTVFLASHFRWTQSQPLQPVAAAGRLGLVLRHVDRLAGQGWSTRFATPDATGS
jgi:hypothetical protein